MCDLRICKEDSLKSALGSSLRAGQASAKAAGMATVFLQLKRLQEPRQFDSSGFRQELEFETALARPGPLF